MGRFVLLDGCHPGMVFQGPSMGINQIPISKIQKSNNIKQKNLSFRGVSTRNLFLKALLDFSPQLIGIQNDMFSKEKKLCDINY